MATFPPTPEAGSGRPPLTVDPTSTTTVNVLALMNHLLHHGTLTIERRCVDADLRLVRPDGHVLEVATRMHRGDSLPSVVLGLLLLRDALQQAPPLRMPPIAINTR